MSDVNKNTCATRGLPPARRLIQTGWCGLNNCGRKFLKESALLPQAESFHNPAVAIRVATVQIVQQPTALVDHHDQPATRCVVLRVALEVVRKVADALAQQCDLHFRGTCIFCVYTELLDHRCLGFAQTTPPQIGTRGLPMRSLSLLRPNQINTSRQTRPSGDLNPKLARSRDEFPLPRIHFTPAASRCAPILRRETHLRVLRAFLLPHSVECSTSLT